MERLAVNKQAAQKFQVERFNFRKLSELEIKKQYQFKIIHKFAVLENLNGGEDENRDSKTLKRISNPQLYRPSRSERIEAALTIV